MNENGLKELEVKVRNDDERKKLINRLSRIEGQIRGIRTMVEKNAYCVDIITQVSAASSALSAFNKELVSSHIMTCVKENAAVDDATLKELVGLLAKIMK